MRAPLLSCALTLVAGPAAVGASCGGSQDEVAIVEVPSARPVRRSEAASRDPWVRVAGAKVRLGAPPGRDVTLPSYAIDRTEVSVAAYQACVDAGRCSAAGSLMEGPDVAVETRERMSQFCIGNRGDRANHPVNCVDASQAAAYCAFVSARLPTEDEWEYAARGPGGHSFPWGDAVPDAELANACDASCARALGSRAMFPRSDGFETTAPVGSHPEGESAAGALDMAGNVAEWVTTGDAPVVKGGGWLDADPDALRITARRALAKESRAPDVGFRCAR